MQLLSVAHPDDPVRDMTLSGELLSSVSSGALPNQLRVYRPGPTVAFGRLDHVRDGVHDACEVAQRHGRTPVVRWGGGHAVAYDQDCVVVELTRSHTRSLLGTQHRFAEMADFIKRACDRLGVAVAIGELPGEYCPGSHSLHLQSGPKIAGVAQRVVPGGSLVTAVIAVSGTAVLKSVVADVYGALGLPVDMATVGSVNDHAPHIRSNEVAGALIDLAAEDYGIAQPRADARHTLRLGAPAQPSR
jgi:octanoyl-[GcvH]:protein N-octanoyltransferase